MITNKVIVITGASSGIGEATASHLASRGGSLVLGARRTDRLKTLAKEITEKGGRAVYSGADKDSSQAGLPTVQELADHLHVLPRYLSDMLRSTLGQNAQEYIHLRLIEKAKTILANSNETVAEIAYSLGFEHPQSFRKLFRKKTDLSPVEFRRSFN